MDRLGELLKEISFDGIFSAEFIEDTHGNMYFSEINFRPDSSNWASSVLDMNLPIMYAEGVLTGRISFDDTIDKQIEIAVLHEFEDYMFRVNKYHMISRCEWLKGVFLADCLTTWNLKDPLPAVYRAMGVIKECHRNAKRDKRAIAVIGKIANIRSEIIVWGTGSCMSHVNEISRLRECSIKFFVDNDINKQGMEIDGVLIMDAEVIRNYEGIVFVALWDYGNEIIEQIHEMGNERCKVILY